VLIEKNSASYLVSIKSREKLMIVYKVEDFIESILSYITQAS